MTSFRVIALNRPVTDYARVDCSSDAYKQSPALRKYVEYLAKKEAERAEFRKTWTAPPPLPPDDEDGFEASAVERAAFDVWKVRRQGRVAAATAPYWHDHVDEWVMGWGSYGPGFLAREPTAASATLPFIMLGGEFSVIFTTEQYRNLSPRYNGDSVQTSLEDNKLLRVRSEHGIHLGELIHGSTEMSYEVVSLPAGTPQDVADRVARAWRAIVNVALPTDYAAVMPLSDRCWLCHRPLGDPVSKVLHIGPECARQLDVSHSAEAASTIITKRQKFLAELQAPETGNAPDEAA